MFLSTHAGVQIAIVVGGGNFFRGANHEGEDMERVNADYMGYALQRNTCGEPTHVFGNISTTRLRTCS